MSNPISLNTNPYYKKMEEGFSMFGPGHFPALDYIPDKQASDTVDIKEKDKKNRPLGKIVACTMAAFGIVALILTKGFSGATAKQISKIFNNFEIKKLTSKNKAVNAIDQTVEKTARRFRKALDFGNTVANITAIKDTAFHELTSWNLFGLGSRFPKFKQFMNTVLPLQKMCNWASKNIFKLTRSAVDSQYKKTGAALDALEAEFKTILRNKNIPSAKRAEIEKLIDEIVPAFRKDFGQDARNVRFEELETSLKNLGDEVREDLAKPVKSTLIAFWEYLTTGKPLRESLKQTAKESGGTFSSYITLKRAEPAISRVQKTLEIAKENISYNIEDVAGKLMQSSTDLKNLIKPEDIESRKLLVDLFKSINKYSELNGSEEAKLREKAMPKIIKILESIKNRVVEPNARGLNGGALYKPNEFDEIFSKIDHIKETLTDSDRKGKLQRLLGEIKDFCGGSKSKEYLAIKDKVNKVGRALNSNIELEGTSMTSKYAETRVGSIPTDVLGLGLMAGGGAWAISKGKDKEEKIGATLKVGVPLLGAIGMYFFAGAKAISGVKNLALSAATGFILNKVGESAFTYYKKRFVEKKSVQEIAKEAYNEATSVN